MVSSTSVTSPYRGDRFLQLFRGGKFEAHELLHLDDINVDVCRVPWTNGSKKGGESVQGMGRHQEACGD